jgi:hypothetical protein
MPRWSVREILLARGCERGWLPSHSKNWLTCRPSPVQRNLFRSGGRTQFEG